MNRGTLGVNNLLRVVARIMPRSESNPRPLDHESSALTTTPPSHHYTTKPRSGKSVSTTLRYLHRNFSGWTSGHVLVRKQSIQQIENFYRRKIVSVLFTLLIPSYDHLVLTTMAPPSIERHQNELEENNIITITINAIKFQNH